MNALAIFTMNLLLDGIGGLLLFLGAVAAGVVLIAAFRALYRASYRFLAWLPLGGHEDVLTGRSGCLCAPLRGHRDPGRDGTLDE